MLRIRPGPGFVFLLLTRFAGPAIALPPGYVDTQACAKCHPAISESYRRTGMSRSFYRVSNANTTNANFSHDASDTLYSIQGRGREFFQRQWQIGFGGKEENSDESRMDLVIGSGNHARTYLHRTERGTLVELPLGWYAEKGGYWAMNPGYDTQHPPVRRPVAYECMFCHNSYPDVASAQTQYGAEPVFQGDLPQGIDCQRCHGPGAAHSAAAARSGAALREVRASIVNPARLSNERQMEVCMQCHLETTSTRLPGLIRRFDPGPFAYRPGQPLGDFMLSFDHQPGTGHDDKFEIASAAYRLRKSQCFLKSAGTMTCTTCHNPHDVPRGAEAVERYSAACNKCHAPEKLAANPKHPARADCIACHMPKRRTDDAVHVVMTDHLIQRNLPDRNLLAEKAEAHPTRADEYRGEVLLYYPPKLPATPETAAYVGLAQVLHGSNLTRGIPQFTAALDLLRPKNPAYYMALGDALHAAGKPADAASAYERAAKLNPRPSRELRFLGAAWREAGQPAKAEEALKKAVALDPNDAQTWFELALTAASAGEFEAAAARAQKAVSINPDLPDAWNSLGANLAQTGAIDQAENALRESLRIDPAFAAAHRNLGRLLMDKAAPEEAIFHFERAERLQPGDAPALYEHALALVRMNRFEDSEATARAAVSADPSLAEGHELLGGLLSRKRDAQGALAEYREAVRLKPQFFRAQLDLAAALAAQGSIDEAILHLRIAARGTDTRIASQAMQALRQLGAAQ